MFNFFSRVHNVNFFVLVLLFSLIALNAKSDQRIFGSWSNDDGAQINLINGFKPNTGPAILFENGEVDRTTSWKINGDELQIGYSSGAFVISADGNSMEWSYKVWKKNNNIQLDGIIDLKVDENLFIDSLVNSSYLAFSNEVSLTSFENTFSTTEGVFTQLDNNEKIKNLSSWGIGSGILKIGDQVYIEAIISNQFLIAADDNDNFIVLKKSENKEQLTKVSMNDSREEFLKNLKSGAWIIPTYYGEDQYRFRPIEGDLKGRVFTQRDNKLSDTRVWEYSPSTGAFKIGYTEYSAGLSLGNEILVFLEDNGDQYSLYKDKEVEDKFFTTSDSSSLTISEREAANLKELISVVSSKSDTFTFFEFNEDNLSGYLHEWKSEPFKISGQSISVKDNYTFNDLETIYSVEDYLVFGENDARKIDLRETRLKPKSDEEAKSDAEMAKELVNELSSQSISLKVELKNGKIEVVNIPVSSFSEVKSISILEK